MQEVVARLQTLSRLPPAEMEALCSDLRALLTGKSVTNQLQAIRKFLEEIHATPLRRGKIFFQGRWQDHLPFAIR
jgi:hypothetical protein